MNKDKRNEEINLAKNNIKCAGLYIPTKKDINKLADVAADAYSDYPLHKWFNNGVYKPKVTRLIIKISLKNMFKKAVIYADSPKLNGFAIWLPSGFTGSKTLPFLYNGGFKFILNFRLIIKLIKFESFSMSLKKKYTNHHDWYLFNITIKKDSQGKKIASKLLNPMLQFCDEQKMPCYLETNSESNVSLYEHFNFKCMEKAKLFNSDVYHYAMVREAK